MQADFWHQKWADNKIGFHQDRVNKRLETHWTVLDPAPSSTVFVPLCGKSLDMLWLHRQGHAVMGVELSQKAVESFFSDNLLDFERRDHAGFQVYTGVQDAAGIELWVGDFFALTAEHLASCRVFYDRAALIAMPADLRRRYAQHLASIIPQGVQGLLLSIAYDEQRMQGPPFSVPEKEVRELLDSGFRVEREALYDGPERVGNLAERGLETLDERVYVLTRLSR